MRQRNLLLLLAVAVVVCITDFTYAKDSNLKSFDETIIRRNLKGDNEVAKTEGDSTDPETEARGLPFKLPTFSSIKSIFGKTSGVGTSMKNNPEFAAAFKNPKVSQAFTEVKSQPGLLKRVWKSNPLTSLAARLRGRKPQFSTRQVTNVGHLAVTSSSSSQLTRRWVKYGAAFLFVLGILFLAATVVYKGLQPN